MSRKPTLIVCARCGQEAEPAMPHAIFCAPCLKRIEHELNLKALEPVEPGHVPAVFRRNDGRIDL